MRLDSASFKRCKETKRRFEKRQTLSKSQEAVKILPTEVSFVKPSHVLKQLNYQNIGIREFINTIETQERILKENDLLPINYFSKGNKTARAVARITIISNSGDEIGYGTGFMVGKNLMMTNNHVLETFEDASNSIVEFEYETDENNLTKSAVTFRFEPEKLFFTSKALDFTILFVADVSITGGKNLSDYGSIKMISKTGKVSVGNSVSIIQHPKGMRKYVALRNNQVTDIFDEYIHYSTDTEPGSSGSPVLNDSWEMVAIHHSGVPKTNAQGEPLTRNGTVATINDQEEDIDWIANEGVRTSSILKHLNQHATNAQKIMLREILQDNFMDNGNNNNSDNTDQDHIVDNSYYDAQKDKTLSTEYYKNIDFDAADLFDKLNKLLNNTHKNKLEYKPSKYIYPDVDLQKSGNISSLYSGKEFTSQELILADEKIDTERRNKFLELSRNESLVSLEDYRNAINEIEESLPYNCEHVVPQSWFSKKSPMRGDLHHLFACESGCNSFRSNIPYFDFMDYEPQLLPEEAIRQSCGKREENKFEPNFNQGVVARATLYYLLRYPKQISQKYSANGLKTLIEWHNRYKVTDYEKRRNMKISQLQGNRNPLIDFPDLVDKIDFKKGI